MSVRFQLSLRGLCAAVVLAVGVEGTAAPEQLLPDREKYDDATVAIDRGQWTEYERLRSDLDDYPLAIYLDYSRYSRSPAKVRPAEARQFLSQSEDSPLPNRFLSVYLTRAGKDRRWNDFLAVMPREPNSITLKCYYFRALLASGDELAAWEGAERLWNHGESRPKECDPLFASWLKAGQLDDDVIWSRMLKAFDARQRSLLGYVARKGSPALAPWSEKLLAVYRKPQQMRQQSLPSDSPYSADIASHGLAYLARYSPEKALDNWLHYQGSIDFSKEQRHTVEYAIALRSLFAKSSTNLHWVESALSRLAEDKLVEIRLRWALQESAWNDVLATLEKLTTEQQEEPVWRYWRAMALSQKGDSQASQKLLASVAAERGYYGFLAADRLGQPYNFEHRTVVVDLGDKEPLKKLPAVQRIEELYFHDKEQLAHSEWYKVVGDRESEQQALAVMAYERGWHRMAIDAANKAKAWDALDLRFPMPYQDTFTHFGGVQRVPATELMAIARRESAFYPLARSPVGARGLMQVMPATGKQVASQIGRSHSTGALYDVEHNVLLGSAYYRQLLDRFDGNRIFALAAYNAGPHRVDRWRNNGDERLSVEIWVETIPFRETRNYVQAVLSYNVVFAYLQGQQAALLTETELTGLY
ncbi:MAG: transglycosylase SLT domain-containing protein [Halioglobus sp.]